MKTWQEHIGAMPHMIAAQAAESGFTALDPQYRNAEGVAVIDVSGVLVNKAWDGWSTSGYGRIQSDIQAALDDPQIDGILLRVNSPGGEVTNCPETADAIIAAGKTKPVWAVADSMAYSAGYWLASAASRVYVSPKTGGVGSIGVYTVHLDMSEMLKQMGVKATFIEDPKGKTDGHPYKPLSAEAKAEMEAQIKYMSGLFFEHVAKRRGLSVADVRNMHARTFDGGQASIDAGLADRIGSLGNALAQMRGYIDGRKENSYFSVAGSAARSNQEVPQMEEPKPKADAPAPPEPNAAAVVEPPATPVAQPEVIEPVASEAEEIIALCAIAGLSAAKAQDFIGQKKSAKDVRESLLAARASEASKTEIISQLQPHSGALPPVGAGGTLKPEDSPLVKAAKKIAAEQAAMKGAR